MRTMTRLVAASAVVCTAWIATNRSGLHAEAPFDIRATYTKSEQMVPMRDGVKLFTIVYAPKETRAQHPFMIHRTP